MDLSILPFDVQLPPGYSLPAGAGGSATTGTGTAAGATDIIAISNTWDAGSFTAASGDVYRLDALFRGKAPSGQTIAGYRIALGAGDGQVLLNGTSIGPRTSFTADEFARLTFTAGTLGSSQSLVVVAQVGTRQPDGTLAHVIDSPAVQITADVTGTRSLNGMQALVAVPDDADAQVVELVKEAAILAVLAGSGRPSLQTDGNATAAVGDEGPRLNDLFHGQAPAGQAIAGYRVALGAGSGQLLLNGDSVSGRTSFTADEFAHLTYTVGADGTQQNIVVAAQTGTRQTDGTLIHTIDSTAVQITLGHRHPLDQCHECAGDHAHGR